MASDAFDERKMLKHTDPGRAFGSSFVIRATQLAHKYFRVYIYFFSFLLYIFLVVVYPLPFRFGHKNAQPNCSNYNNLHKRKRGKVVGAEIKKRKALGAKRTEVCYAFCNLFRQPNGKRTTQKFRPRKKYKRAL